MKTLWTVALCLTLCPTASAGEKHAADGKAPPPKDPVAAEVRAVVEKSVAAVLAVLKDRKTEKEKKKKKVMDIIDPVFDFPLMAKLVLGRSHWPEFDKKQRSEFTKLFVAQLRDSYFDKVDLLTDETVEYSEPEEKGGKYSMLTHVVSKGERYEMLYKLYDKDKAWRVYDLELEGISLVRSYGAQYDQFLASSTPDALLRKLKEKTLEPPKDLKKKEDEIRTRTGKKKDAQDGASKEGAGTASAPAASDKAVPAVEKASGAENKGER